MTEPFDSDWWDERITQVPSGDGWITGNCWRRWRLVDELLQRFYKDFGLQPIFEWMGTELYQVALASPTCARAPRYFGRLCETGVHAADRGDMGMVNNDLSSIQLASHESSSGSVEFNEPCPFDRFLKEAIAMLSLGEAGVVGHEKCFHRRGRDLTPLMYRVALLLRTDKRDGPVPKDAMWTVRPWEGDTKQSNERDPADVVLISHGEKVPQGPPRFTGVKRRGQVIVLGNDGRIFAEQGIIDAAAMWRSGDSVTEIADAARNLVVSG